MKHFSALTRLAVTTVTASLVFTGWGADPGFHWTPAGVEVTGLPAETLRALPAEARTPEAWQQWLRVSVEPEDVLAAVTLPAMLGDYAVTNGRLRFTAAYPLAPGVRYRASLRLAGLPGQPSAPALITSQHSPPAPPRGRATEVAQIHPSAAVLPENLLKFYLHFSAPMSRGQIYQFIQLQTADGQPVDLPFLEIDEELWDPAMRRLTLFIDPGRIKREVKPLEEIGPALEAGRAYELIIDPRWPDAQGQPLRGTHRHAFKVGPPDRTPIDPQRWRLEPPAARTTHPLTVHLGESLDHALALRLIRVLDAAGNELPGEPRLSEAETVWRFVPRQPWAAGPHQLVIAGTLEDLAGNNIGKPFEVDLFERVDRRVTTPQVRLPFTVPGP